MATLDLHPAEALLDLTRSRVVGAFVLACADDPLRRLYTDWLARLVELTAAADEEGRQ